MTSQVLFRTDAKTKEAFKLKTQREGVSMDHILNAFVQTYIERPNIVKTYIDDDAFDAALTKAWSDPSLKPAFESLFATIKSRYSPSACCGVSTKCSCRFL